MSKESSCALARIRDIENKIRTFKDYSKRTEVIHEVISDQLLLAEKSEWKLNFIVDFHQVYQIAFLSGVKFTSTIKDRKINVELIFPGEEEKSNIFRDRLRKSIPFFGLSRVKQHPILIDPYMEELEISIRSQFERLLRKKLKNVIFDNRDDINKVKEKWINIINNLEESSELGIYGNEDEKDHKLKQIVDEFSKLTVESFYILSLVNAVNGIKIIKYLLTDSAQEKGKRLRLLPNSEKAALLLEESDFLPWLEILNQYRFKTFSNVIDAKAIATVKKLNKTAQEENRKDIYFLFSDAKNIKFALMDVNDKRDKNVSPNIKTSQNNATNILRTSCHFEEYMMAYNENLDIQIKNLYSRKERLIKETEVISPQIHEMSKKCKKNPQKCPCDFQVRCTELKEKIGEFFKTEEEKTNLSSIIEKEIIFEPLLKFTKEFIRKDMEEQIPEIQELNNVYTNFFFKEYSNNMFNQLKSILSKYEEELFENISSIVTTISTAENSVIATMSSLKKMEGIIFHIAFNNNERIKNLMTKVFSRRSKDIEEQVLLDRDWYQEVYKAIHENRDNVEGTLLVAILLFCNESFDDSWWLANHWLENKLDDIKKSNKFVEFNFILRSSAAWIEYLKKNRFSKMNLDQIKSSLIKLGNEYSKDPRIPYLIGKLVGLKFEFTLQMEVEILEEAIEYFRKAIQVLDALKQDSEMQFEQIRPVIENNILWCIIHLKEPSNALLNEAEILYNRIRDVRTNPQTVETFASYNHLKAQKIYSTDKNKSRIFFEEALYLLIYAIKLEKAEKSLNPKELDILIKEWDEWKAEYINCYDNSIQDVLDTIKLKIDEEFFGS